MKKLVVVLVVVVLIFALSVPAFAFGGVPAAHAPLGVETGRDFGGAVSATVQTCDGLAFFVDHVSTWKPGLNR